MDNIGHGLFGGLQLELQNAGNMYTGIYSGFTDLDYGLVSILCAFIGIKFDNIKEHKILVENTKHHTDALNSVNELLKDRAYVELVMHIKEMLPPIVGYEHVGVYLYNSIDDELYTHLRSQYMDGVNTMVKYPVTTGITGKTFRDNTSVVSLKGKSERNFHEIDNIESYGNIHDLYFTPIYGFGEKKIGVMQFFNKKKGIPGDDNDNFLKTIQKTIGILLHNIMDYDKSVDIILKIKNILDKLQKESATFLKEKFKHSYEIDDVQISIQNIRQILSAYGEFKSAAIQKFKRLLET